MARPFEQPDFRLAVPTYITFRATAASRFISAYCDDPERVVSIIQRTVEQAGDECLSVN